MSGRVVVNKHDRSDPSRHSGNRVRVAWQQAKHATKPFHRSHCVMNLYRTMMIPVLVAREAGAIDGSAEGDA
jgi:hypothetical protein